MRKRILATLLAFVLLFSGGAVTAYAYNVAVSGGLESTPYSLRWHSSMTTAKKNAISSACGAWTSAGYGKLAELSSYSHTNSYPTDNNYNEISFTDSLEDDVLAQCHRVFTSIFRTKIETADIGISIFSYNYSLRVAMNCLAIAFAILAAVFGKTKKKITIIRILLSAAIIIFILVFGMENNAIS